MPAAFGPSPAPTVGRIVHYLPFGAAATDDVGCGTFLSACQAALVVDVDPAFEPAVTLCVFGRENAGLTFESMVSHRPWAHTGDRPMSASWHWPERVS